MKKFLAVLVSLSLTVAFVPAAAFAATDDLAAGATAAAVQEEHAESVALEGAHVEGRAAETAGSPSNDELFAAYVDQQFMKQKEGASALQTASSSLARAQLTTDYQKAAYDYLHEQILNVARGDSQDAQFTLPLSEFVSRGYIKQGYTKEDLGLETVLNSGQPTQEATDAVAAKATEGYSEVVDALRQDCPYELFWFQGSVGYSFEISGNAHADQVKLNSLTMSFQVSPDYRGSSSSLYRTSSSIASVRTAADKAGAIVAKHKNESDFEKLASYCGEICSMTAYNDEAAKATYNHETQPNNPWQLIWVFDGDVSTKVVCEGYAKAFKYLCELSTFKDSTLACYDISGWMRVSGSSSSGQAHMWNIVRMGDASYLVDVTNCDAGAAGGTLVAHGAASGNEPGTGLFMRGSATTAAVDGAPSSQYSGGYRISLPAQRVNAGSATFTAPAHDVDYYYETESNKVVPGDVLALAGADYKIPLASSSAVIADQTYSGQQLSPSPIVRFNGCAIPSYCYDVSYSGDRTNVGTASFSVTAKAGSRCTGAKSGSFRIVRPAVTSETGSADADADANANTNASTQKAANPLKVKASAKTVKLAKLKKKAQAVKPLKVTGAAGKVSYKNVSSSKKLKKFKVNAKTGKVTVPKNTKKGTYKVKVKVSAAGNASYKGGSKTVTCKIKVK